ncbi:helix-turn-helix domain-containing protein [Streptomyces sp. NBC_01190]|uniref:helix-turn-helix domain-containing protein n=1 Tax=Streptomyces sp. NBC_01190 TaxID=2903767 RepID=UPI00386A5FB2|nr:helix-turn-helix transcriptional regulator [Streptomyces sp. NBC_01190]
MRSRDSPGQDGPAEEAGGDGGGSGSPGGGTGGRALGDFLRARRAAADPARLGFPGDGKSRRVPGLRREELAELAHVSTDYIVRIEQGRKRRVSGAVLTALADALKLTDDERLYLFAVAGVAPAPPGAATAAEDRVPKSVLLLLDNLTGLPALVLNRRMDILAWNRLATGLLGDFGTLSEGPRNLVRLIYLDPSYRTLFGDGWEPMAKEAVAVLRMEAGRRPQDAALQALVGELCVRDERFGAWWAAQTVSGPRQRRKVYHHPMAGPLTLEVEVLAIESCPGLSLVTYTPSPGSHSEQGLRFLAELAERISEDDVAAAGAGHGARGARSRNTLKHHR